MRQVFLCLFALAGVLGAFDYVATANTTALVASVQSPKGDLKIDRTLKGDRQMAVIVNVQAPAPAAKAVSPAPVSARLPDGCEPSVSPLAGKQVSATIRARCIS